MATEISIDIAPDGTQKLTVKGVKGRACRELTREFERKFGKVTATEDTKETNEVQPGRVTQGS